MSCASAKACSGLKASAEAIRGYNSAMDQLVPWQSMQGHVDALSRYKNDYSTLAAHLVGDITTAMYNGRDEYNKATRAVYEWCLLTIPLLTGLLRLLQGNYMDSVKAQKVIILKVLNQGTRHLDAAKDGLQASSVYLNDAAGKLVKLQTQLRNDSENDSAYFRQQIRKIRAAYLSNLVENMIAGPIGLLVSLAEVAEGEAALVPKLKRHLTSISNKHGELKNRTSTIQRQIQTARQHIEHDKSAIAEMSAKTEEAKVWFDEDLDEMIEELTKASNDLIDLCSTYTKRHGHR